MRSWFTSTGLAALAGLPYPPSTQLPVRAMVRSLVGVNPMLKKAFSRELSLFLR